MAVAALGAQGSRRRVASAKGTSTDRSAEGAEGGRFWQTEKCDFLPSVMRKIRIFVWKRPLEKCGWKNYVESAWEKIGRAGLNAAVEQKLAGALGFRGGHGPVATLRYVALPHT